jgi:hypothetical protein
MGKMDSSAEEFRVRREKVIEAIGDSQDNNTLAEPRGLAPVIGRVQIPGTRFRREFPPGPLTILRMNTK